MVEFICDRMSRITRRGRWRDSIVQNVHAASAEDKRDNTKDRFYVEPDRVFCQSHEVQHERFVRRFQCKVGRENIFKATIGNESLHEINLDNGFRVVSFATSENLIIKSTMFPHRNIHNYICGTEVHPATYPMGTRGYFPGGKAAGG